VVRGLDLVAHLRRTSDGGRRLVQIAAVVPAAGGVAVREVWPS